ncbi:MAG: hypothetical protein HY888_11130 [Deltaproteobacteria bacterium]|nr:hypothetical protein [Deltaproteobacteria bacterium]
MSNTLKNNLFQDISDEARRQYLDARATFEAWEDARKKAADVRGGMFWKHQGRAEYLIRTSTRNAQKSLGPRSEETVRIYESFTARKKQAEQRLSDLTARLTHHQKLNRVLQVGRAPRLLVEILNQIEKSGLSEYFIVVGTHALYAYEAAAGVRFGDSDALATNDIDLLRDTRKRLSFFEKIGHTGSSMLNIIKKVDPTFEIRFDQKYTAVNSKGFEIDIIRREANHDDPHPLRLSDEEDEFYAVQARNAGLLLDGPRFSTMIVATSGHMARINTVSPVLFTRFKKWMSEQPDREPLRRRRDALQSDRVLELVTEYLPHLVET